MKPKLKFITLAIISLLLLNSVSSFLIGFTSATLFNVFSVVLTTIGIPLNIIVVLFLMKIYSKGMFRAIFSKPSIYYFISHILNLLFIFSIGYSIPFMESPFRFNLAVVMLPLLLILDIIIFHRFQFKLKEEKGELEYAEFDESLESGPIIEFEGRKYIFSIRSIILLAIGAPLSAYLIYSFFDTEMNFWLHEIVVKQTVFFLNLFFNMGTDAVYLPIGKYFWYFDIPGRPNIFFETFCTGVQAIVVFAGIILFTPHSKDPATKKDIVWRKTKALVVSSAIFYVVNIIRMLIQIELYFIGYPWEDIHVSISAASSFIAAIIMLLMHKWIPEFIISIIYTGAYIKQKFKKGAPAESEKISELKVEKNKKA